MSGAIWLASYPKSGNTWVRLALYSLAHDGADVALADISDFGTLASSLSMIDWNLEIDSGLMTDDELESIRPAFHAALFDDPVPRLCKVHDAWTRTLQGRPLFDPAITHASIYVVRDPRDVAVSYAPYFGTTLDRAVDIVIGKRMRPRPRGQQVRQKLLGWGKHVTSWVDESGLAPLVIRYEDMLAQPEIEIARIARSLGWATTTASIAGAVAATRFDRLAEMERRTGFCELSDKAERFFRVGAAGQWRGALTAEQAARIERAHGAVMARFGYC